MQGDIQTRYRALAGDEVFFTTGTDEHGQKIHEAAKQAGQSEKDYVDSFAAKFRELKSVLNLSDNIHFIRTTDPDHEAAAQHIWKLCQENTDSEGKSDIYKKTYKGLC